ncbi:hypothetical protein C5167_012064 [Papaver somniferum]|uniref:BHLH domain-containing protein n=1 Tax=Papaver somniferum TaxID=3469 RepID=A0A4Y7J0C8_PAPSO|nr:uncharacterized protein LOC113355293 [Papaver somniferum]RZC53208.1 hypothetical protein C5167_012064 [Papaver somniferum]
MDDVGRKRGRHNFVEMMQTASDEFNGKEGSPNEFSDSSEASSYESNDKEASSSSELDGKETVHRPNHKKAKSTTTDPLGDFSKLGVLDKRDDLNCSNAQEPLSDLPGECSRRVSENRVSALPTRPTVSNAGTARDVSQGSHVSSLSRQSILARSGYGRDIPRSVLVDSSVRKSAATGFGRDIPFAVPFDPLPTGSTLIHGGSARRVSDAIPFRSLPTIPTAYHSGYARDIALAVPITVRSTTDVRELTGIRQGLLHNHTGGASNLGDSFGHNLPTPDEMQSIHQMLNGNYLQASQITSHGVEFLKTLLSNKVPILAQDPASAAPGLTQDFHQGPKVTVAVPSYCSKQRINYVNRKSGRIRRARITERFKSLQEILPNSDQANRDDLMDDIIDYVKYLQLQIKSLSQSTLEDETADHSPFINLEGFGHYLHNQGTLVSEPLEDMVGMLMQVNKPAFTQLLESRGLYVKPMALAGKTIYKP